MDLLSPNDFRKLNESKEDSTFDSKDFIKFIEKELKWNGAKVIEIDDIRGTGYLYTCYPGQSVIKDIKEAGTKYGVKLKVNRSGDTGRRTDEHEYLIKILKK